jgi:hypothetical protein
MKTKILTTTIKIIRIFIGSMAVGTLPLNFPLFIDEAIMIALITINKELKPLEKEETWIKILSK